MDVMGLALGEYRLWALWVWIYCLIVWLIQDAAKVGRTHAVGQTASWWVSQLNRVHDTAARLACDASRLRHVWLIWPGAGARGCLVASTGNRLLPCSRASQWERHLCWCRAWTQYHCGLPWTHYHGLTANHAGGHAPAAAQV
jgi:hypothetical protein